VHPVGGTLPQCLPWDKFVVNLAPGARWAKPEDLGSGPTGDLRRLVRKRFGGTIVMLDYDCDGLPDLLLVGAVVENGGLRDLLLHNDGNGVFTDVTASAGLAEARPSLGCAVADFDNDGFPDLFITGAGTQKLFRNKGDGTFEDVTARAGLDRLKDVCMGAAWVDLQQDGNLDLLVTQYADTPENAVSALMDKRVDSGGIAVFMNAGEADTSVSRLGRLSIKFQRRPDLEKQFRVDGNPAALPISDVRGYGTLDAIALADRSSPALFVNDRILGFRRVLLDNASANQRWNGALALDVNQDGRSDLFVLPVGLPPRLLVSGAVAGQDPATIFQAKEVRSPPLLQARTVDFDLDGFPDVVGLSDQGKPVFLHNNREGRLTVVTDSLGADRQWPRDAIAVTASDLNGSGFPDVLVWSEFEGLKAFRNQGNGNHSVKVRPVGRRFRGDFPVERTNRDGIGTRLVLQSGWHWATCEVATMSAGLGQSSEPMQLGLGRESLKDAVLRVTWPDMTVQAEFLDLPNNELCHKIARNIFELTEYNRFAGW